MLREPSASNERRVLPRADVAMWVQERTNDAIYFQRATNLSVGGVWLEGTLPHPPGTRVVLELRIGDQPIRAAGEVIGRAPGQAGMAVRFVDLEQRDRERIAYVVATRASS